CWQLATRADPAAGVLAFVDADVVLSPYAVAAAVTELRAARAALLSPYPRILVATVADRLVQPLLQWLWLTFLPLRAMERSPRPSLAAAGGQFLVVDRAGYLRAGGHAAVADKVLEDIELARAVKRSGGRIALADGSRLAACRMYETWPQLRDGYSKSLWASFGHPTAAAVVVALLLLLYTAPPLLAVAALAAGLTPTALLVSMVALIAYLLGVAGRVVSARATGGRAWPDALVHPVSVVVLGWLTFRSYHLRKRRRLTWRGRPVS
ncbi:MAG: glycosyltransferase, partial [Micromonospora sp.]